MEVPFVLHPLLEGSNLVETRGTISRSRRPPSVATSLAVRCSAGREARHGASQVGSACMQQTQRQPSTTEGVRHTIGKSEVATSGQTLTSMMAGAATSMSTGVPVEPAAVCVFANHGHGATVPRVQLRGHVVHR